MINAVQTAMSQIYATIPPDILTLAFRPDIGGDQSLDDLIMQNVILARVRDDVSVRGGKILDLILSLEWAEYTSSPSVYALGIAGSYSTYRIPPEAREHRDISCILSVRFPYTIQNSVSGQFYNTCSMAGNTLAGMAQSALQTQTGAMMLANPHALLYPGNVITLEPPQVAFIPWNVKVRLRYDDNFSGMDVSSIRPFAILCELAVKAYIHTNLILQIESNSVYHGMEIGEIRNIVSRYEDANDKYEEQLLTLGGAELYDPARTYNILKRCIPRK